MGKIKQIVQDTREQKGKHKNIEKYMSENNIEIFRDKLFCGDYSLPIDRKVCIDIKQDVVEIAGNLCSNQHARFRDECIRAMKTGTQLYVLIEENECNGFEITCPEDLVHWESPKFKYGQRKGQPLTFVKGSVLAKTMRSMETKYGVTFLFCNKEESGKIILQLLGDN
jgi:hypothetical protein